MQQRVILIDHDDSFSFILAQTVGAVTGVMPIVLNHRTTTVQEVEKLAPTHLILSPGPGTVENSADFAIGHQLIDRFEKEIPILGVCLGHQGIAAHYGARITHAPAPMHGKRSQVQHNGEDLFQGLQNPLTVMRYHSLVVTDLPKTLLTTAHSEDGAIMALRHQTLAIFGIQFHPESVGTENGQKLLRNFLELQKEIR